VNLNPQIRELKSGLKTIFLPNPGSQAVYVAVLVNTGTRDESPELNGVSHFIEHMVFKGTEKRKAFHILNRLDSVGGELNAYTTKEQTCYYASVAKEHAERAVELLSDILLHSVFPEAEMEKEKSVIAEEIDMYQDYPEETIIEDFEAALFPNQAIGRPILGTRESLQKLNRKKVVQHCNSWYRSDTLVVGICGDIPSEKALAMAEKYFEEVTHHHAPKHLTAKPSGKKFHLTSTKALQQSHVFLGHSAPSRNEANHWPLQLLTNLLGGPAMNSRLNLSIREKYGLVYQISSTYTSFEDTGYVGIYFSSEEKKREKVISLVQNELNRILKEGISQDALDKAIRQFTGNALLQQDNRQSLLHFYLREVFQPAFLPAEAYIEKIKSVTRTQIQTCAEKYLNPDKVSMIEYFPEASEK
jgi:predicted Zn-dependent peptidase